MLAIIGGSGLTRLSTLAVAHREVVRTPYGDPSSTLLFGQIAGRDAVFLARHGHGHTIPPHRVNYRANLWALKQQGRDRRSSPWRRSAASAAAGPATSCCRTSSSTTRRAASRRSSTAARAMSSTSTSRTRTRRRCASAASQAAQAAGIALTDGGVYGAVNGPRLETAAEIDRMERDGATLVGMTGMPEAALARELGVPYVAICVVVNHAAGRGDSARAISMEGIAQVLEAAWTRSARCSTTSSPIASGDRGRT